MWKRLTPNKASIVPHLMIAQRVIDKIANAATQYVEDETGEAMIGCVGKADAEGIPTVYVLDTIAPDESAIREAHHFQQGDERQSEMLWWFAQNWNQRREEDRKRGLHTDWDLPLRHLGDWHRQPGNMIAPSGGDLMTALDLLDDEEADFEFLLAPIVTLDHPATTGAGEPVNYITVPQDEDSFLRIDFWYIDKHSRRFLPMTPVIMADNKAPAIAGQPWHLIREDRFRAEMTQLNADRLFTSVVTWDTDGKPPLEVCIMMGRQGASQVFIIATPWDYPDAEPVAYSAPFLTLGEDEVMYEMIGRMWQKAEKLKPPPGWKWTEDRYLIDFVRALETHLGLRNEATQSEQSANKMQGGSDVG